jgi:hypothetical protein
MKEYKVLESRTAEGLTILVNKYLAEGWVTEGSHQAVVSHAQNRYSGRQHMDTNYRTEYSQTIKR